MPNDNEPGITRVNLSSRVRLADVIKRIEAIPMGGTDCALPIPTLLQDSKILHA